MENLLQSPRGKIVVAVAVARSTEVAHPKEEERKKERKKKKKEKEENKS